MQTKRKFSDGFINPPTKVRILPSAGYIDKRVYPGDKSVYPGNIDAYPRKFTYDEIIKEKNNSRSSFHVARILSNNATTATTTTKIGKFTTENSAFTSFNKSSTNLPNAPESYHRLYNKQIHSFKNNLAVEVNSCTDPCCVPSPHFHSPTESGRSSESGSANSSGSTSTSYKPLHNRAPYEHHNGAPYEHYALCTGPCCKHSVGNRTERLNRYHGDRYTVGPVYHDSSKREQCSCPQCHVNREFVRRGSFNEDPSSLCNKSKVRSPLEEDYLSRKTLSKRKALLSEMEHQKQRVRQHERDEVRHNIIARVHKDDEVTIDKREIKIEEADSPENRLELISDNKSITGLYERMDEYNQNEEKWSSAELLKIPPGPNRSRAVANLLERRRVAELNSAFERLRVLVPTYGNEDRALSKIKTLRYALNYMNHLMLVVNNQARTGHFDEKQDFVTLCRKDPMIQKCKEHMLSRKIF